VVGRTFRRFTFVRTPAKLSQNTASIKRRDSDCQAGSQFPLRVGTLGTGLAGKTMLLLWPGGLAFSADTPPAMMGLQTFQKWFFAKTGGDPGQGSAEGVPGSRLVTVWPKQLMPCAVMPPSSDSPPSLPASLSPQQSTLHACPIVQATSADLDIWQHSLCLPVAQSATADWQPCQQPFLVNETGLAKRSSGRKICLLAIHVAALFLIMAKL
jgi:hypothetical protein